jgi:hypothetical protein
MSNSDLRPGSDEEWQELLRQLPQSRPQPQPFFYARVHARLSAERARPLAWLPSWLRRPAYAAVLGGLLLAVRGDGTPLRAAPAPSQLGQLAPSLTH